MLKKLALSEALMDLGWGLLQDLVKALCMKTIIPFCTKFNFWWSGESNDSEI